MADLVEIERAKLLANALDRAPTACFTVGVIAPTAAALYGAGSFIPGPLLTVVIAAGWILAGLALHWTARLVLGALRS